MPPPANYSAITEAPGLQATQEQIARLVQRYRFAAQFAEGKRVLEAACGSGMGLAYLASRCERITGIDIDPTNLTAARRAGQGIPNVSVELMDAQATRFADASFDLILLFEAIYYLNDPGRFVSESHRLLTDSGTLIVCTVNRDWKDFHPSPYSSRYFSVPELRDLLKTRFSRVDFFGGGAVHPEGLKAKALSWVKRAAVRLDLIPGSLGARAVLKRIFIGKTLPLPERIDDAIARYEEPAPLADDRPVWNWKIIYALARKQAP
jgi:SAM-dependent methyltransferase